MIQNGPKFKHDPRRLVDCLFSRAKRWLILVNLSRACSVLLGITSAFLFSTWTLTPVVVFMLYVLSEVATWRSEAFKRSAETVLRKLDFWDSFAWEISSEEMSDFVIDCPSRLRKKIPPPAADDYFASREEPGPTRALENLQESAWWTKHLARRMGHILLFITIAVTIASMIVLLAGIGALQNQETLGNVGRTVTAALMLVLSLGLARLTLAYYQLGKRAEQSEREASRQLKSTTTLLDVVKAWHDYQVARAGAPLIPNSLWRLKRSELNEAWKNYRI